MCRNKGQNGTNHCQFRRFKTFKTVLLRQLQIIVSVAFIKSVSKSVYQLVSQSVSQSFSQPVIYEKIMIKS